MKIFPSKKVLFVFIFLLNHFSTILSAENKFNIVFQPFARVRPPLSISGFSRVDLNFDTRQIVPALGEFGIFFPQRKVFDVECRDINAQPRFDILAIQSILQIVTNVPNIAGGNAIAAVEGYFAATSTIAFFQLRHAVSRITWPNRNFVLTFGQYWHPLFIPEVTPNTVSLARGIPVAILSRNPQVTFEYYWRNEGYVVSALVGILAQGAGNLSNGPLGFAGVYSRNGVMPDLAARIQFNWGKHIFGGAVDVKRLRPRLVSNNNFKVDETIVSGAGTLYMGLNWKKCSIDMKVNIGQNMANFNMISGYAVQTVNPITDERTYANIRVASGWIDFNTFGYKIQPGIFIGYAQNLGAKNRIIPSITNPDGTVENTVYSLGGDIDSVLIFSPRVRFKLGNFIIAQEMEANRAAYGTINNFGRVVNTNPVFNFRFITSMYYFF